MTHEQAKAAKCPAAEPQQPVLSPNPLDFECRIMGNLMPQGMRPCDGCYSECPVWRNHKEAGWANRTVAGQAELRRRAERHTVTSTDRPVVHA